MENLLWESDIISFQGLQMCTFLFWPLEPHKVFMGSLQSVFSCGCLWWNPQIISFVVSLSSLGLEQIRACNDQLYWNWQSSDNDSQQWNIIYNRLWIQFNTYPGKKFLVQKSKAYLSALTFFKRNIQKSSQNVQQNKHLLKWRKSSDWTLLHYKMFIWD